VPRRDDISKILLIGSGPIVIGQAAEFDYSGVQACKVLAEEGYEVVLVNSNPATIMTDPEFAHRTYVEPLTRDSVAAILERERPEALLPTLGGQTALNLAKELHDDGTLAGLGVELVGADYEAIHRAEDREAFLEHDFEAYYASEPGTTFAARVFTNNAQVGALAFATGIAFAIPTLLVLALNAVNVGIAAGLFHAAGDAARFWGLILPHGLLELAAVFVAGGAGLRLGWAVIAPGERTRRAALSDEGRRAIVIVIGLVVVFGVAAVIEAFVTPAPWPTWARVGTGAMACGAFLAYVAVFGRRASARGLTGALREQAAFEDDRYRPPVALTSR
jgi:uncharacterized membrane protein SpoIIM required for sporulation